MTEPQKINVLTFRLGGETLGLPTMCLNTVIEPVPVTRLPLGNTFSSGLINVRGSIVPLADLSVPLQLPKMPESEATRMLILEKKIGDSFGKVALLADEVQEVATIDPNDVEDARSLGSNWPARLLRGVLRHKDDFVILPDLDRILKEFSAQEPKNEKEPA